ncbi:hypothetical protein F53441_11481 [Fusarium austroafricanum]|uniref:CFEM domain-containing protein n=1 Tax=Fusarium austroafricanum TaxID=2364996 RepID=A0A8H4K3X5_9HYPO|nr:hypothetical protein F53441_11481 [Fusarium austroafricanum]
MSSISRSGGYDWILDTDRSKRTRDEAGRTCMNRLLWLAAWACLVCQVVSLDVTEFLSQIPKCATSCLVDLASNSTCGLDVECLCGDPKLKTSVSDCVQKACLPIDSLTAMNATSVACDYPIRDKHAQFDRLAITMSAVTAIIIGLRLFQRLRFDISLRPDDYIIVFCFAVDLANTITCIYGLSGNGLGQDTWRFSPETITTYLCYLYIGQILYATDMFATKICVALLYLRIFPVVLVQRLIWGTIAVCVLGLVVFDILAIAQCRPISFYWTGWDKLHEGHCLAIQPLAWSIAATGIILDFWMLAIPIWQLVLLQMKWQRKVAVGLMFTVGTFVTIVSILRLRYLVAFGNSQNPTWDSFNTCYWSVIEINVGIWCVCMPDLRLLLLRVFPRLRSTGASGKGPHQGPGGQQGQSSSGNQTDRSIYRTKSVQVQRAATSSTAELVEMDNFASGGRNHSHDAASYA